MSLLSILLHREAVFLQKAISHAQLWKCMKVSPFQAFSEINYSLRHPTAEPWHLEPRICYRDILQGSSQRTRRRAKQEATSIPPAYDNPTCYRPTSWTINRSLTAGIRQVIKVLNNRRGEVLHPPLHHICTNLNQQPSYN
jgi:hypothetical protein